jgi:hypothetical protein
MIPQKLIDEAIELQFKNISCHDFDLFTQGITCAEILLKDIAIDFAKYCIANEYPHKVSPELFEQFMTEKYKKI